MRRRILALAARRPLTSVALLLAVGLAGASALVGDAEEPAGNPRLVLGRVWFDRYPEKRTEEVQIFIFLAGGIGIYEKGSAWRASNDIFEFERQGDALRMTFLHDKKNADTKFTVRACDEKPPFDLCLDLQDSPRGPKRYYGFGDADEAARQIPWGQAMLKAAEGRAGAR